MINVHFVSFCCHQAARNNMLLAVPALLYAINNYLKFTMQVKPQLSLSFSYLHLVGKVIFHCLWISTVFNCCSVILEF